MSCTSLTSLKAFLQIPAGLTTQDVFLNQLVDGVNTEIARLLGFSGSSGLTLQSFNESYSIECEDERMLCLKHCPVSSVTALTNAGQLVNSADYWVTEAGILQLKSRTFAGTVYWGSPRFFIPGYQSVQIMYQAGYAGGVCPSDLTLAANMMAAQIFNTGPKTGFLQERIGQYSYKMGQIRSGQDDPAVYAVRRILGKYLPDVMCIRTDV